MAIKHSLIKMLILFLGVVLLTSYAQDTLNLEEYESNSAQANQVSLRQRPIVQASANVVDIDDRQVPGEAYGPLFVGSDAQYAVVAYDTMVDWTVVSRDIDLDASATAKLWTEGDGDVIERSVDLGPGFVLSGPVYNDTVCLIHPGDPGDKSKGRLCVQSLPFIRAPIDTDDNTYQGVLGLARGPGDRWSFVKYLQSQKVIRRAVVSFNFEALDNDAARSQVGFGIINYNLIEGEQAGTNSYSNLGREKWGVLIDDFYYDGQDMTNGQKAKVALIDSANSSIQLPEQVWANTVVVMQHQLINENHQVVRRTTEKGMWEMRFKDKKCSEVWGLLKPIEFKIENTKVVLYPEAYTFQTYEDQNVCQIGLHTVEGSTSEYRLGAIFLQNFYTALDFDNDEIHIGVNKFAARTGRAKLIGSTATGPDRKPRPVGPKNPIDDPTDPNSPGSSSSAGTIVAIVLIILFSIITVFIVLYVRKHQAKEKHIKNKTGSEKTSGKVKPTGITGINDTKEESGSDTELSSEENNSSEGSGEAQIGDTKDSVIKKGEKEVHYLNQNPDLDIEQGANGSGSDKDLFEDGNEIEQPLIYKSSSQKRKEEIVPKQENDTPKDDVKYESPSLDEKVAENEVVNAENSPNDDDENDESSPVPSDEAAVVAESSDIVDENEDDDNDENLQKENEKEEEDDEGFDIEGSNDDSPGKGSNDESPGEKEQSPQNENETAQAPKKKKKRRK